MNLHRLFRHLSHPVLSILLSFLAACSSETIEIVAPPRDAAHVEAGKVIALGLGACGFCHGSQPTPDAPLSGGREYRDVYGTVEVPNITPAKGALGDWKATEFMQYFRLGLNSDFEALSQVPHRGMEWMADRDLFSLAAYLNSLAPVKNKSVHAQPLSFLDRNTSGFFESRREVTGFVDELPRKPAVRYGQYLVNNVAGCGRCHNSPDSSLSSGDFLAGGREIKNEFGEKIAPNITNSEADGIGEWSEGEIVTYLKSGQKPNGKLVDPKFCPVQFYRNAPESDLMSVARFLKIVAPE